MRTSISDLLRMHKALAARLDTSQPGQNDWRFAALGAVTEISEAIQLLPWRPWRAADNRLPTEIELAAALPELVDAVGAIFKCVVNLGISPDVFEAACVDHIRVKQNRLDCGHDR